MNKSLEVPQERHEAQQKANSIVPPPKKNAIVHMNQAFGIFDHPQLEVIAFGFEA
jgi:hypothetical protein